MHSNKDSGFHVVEVVLAVGVLILLGLVGYRVWQAQHPVSKTASPSQAASVPQVKTTKDLDTASTFVDQVNASADTSDLTKLQQELDSL